MDDSKDDQLEELLKRAWKHKLGQGHEEPPEENSEPKDPKQKQQEER